MRIQTSQERSFNIQKDLSSKSAVHSSTPLLLCFPNGILTSLFPNSLLTSFHCMILPASSCLLQEKLIACRDALSKKAPGSIPGISTSATEPESAPMCERPFPLRGRFGYYPGCIMVHEMWSLLRQILVGVNEILMTRPSNNNELWPDDYI